MIAPSLSCRNCKHFVVMDEPDWYIDNYHFYCNALHIKNKYGDYEPKCVDNYTLVKNKGCPRFKENN